MGTYFDVRHFRRSSVNSHCRITTLERMILLEFKCQLPLSNYNARTYDIVRVSVNAHCRITTLEPMILLEFKCQRTLSNYNARTYDIVRVQVSMHTVELQR